MLILYLSILTYLSVEQTAIGCYDFAIYHNNTLKYFNECKCNVTYGDTYDEIDS